MKVARFNGNDIQGLRERFRLSYIWALVDDNGKVLKELGFSDESRIVHKFPGQSSFEKYGVFDTSIISLEGESEISVEYFLELWESDTNEI